MNSTHRFPLPWSWRRGAHADQSQPGREKLRAQAGQVRSVRSTALQPGAQVPKPHLAGPIHSLLPASLPPPGGLGGEGTAHRHRQAFGARMGI